ncbi:MAG TPA: acyltransferase [Acidimicrobiales bacterium]|nr:acyltransferase [Acidimicrobiales bacterium]
MSEPAASPTATAAPPKYLRIQALRTLAAGMVVAYHVANRSYFVLGRTYASNSLDFGNIGIDVFFVLSGFIIFSVHRVDIGHRSETWRYASKRVVRIFPLYWIATALGLAVYATGYGDATKRDLSVILKSIVLFPQKDPAIFPIVNVGWTLTYELVFYAMFLLLIWWPRWPAILAWTAWLGSAAGVAVLRATGVWHPPVTPLFTVLLSDRNLEFLIGCGVAWLVARRSLPSPRALMWAGLVVTLGLCLKLGIDSGFRPFNGDPVPLFALPIAAMVLGAAALDRRGVGSPPSIVVRLGDASYALYLVHFSLITAAFELYKRIGPASYPALLVFGAATAAGVCVVALYVHEWVEAPLLRRLRKSVVPAEHPTRSES